MKILLENIFPEFNTKGFSGNFELYRIEKEE